MRCEFSRVRCGIRRTPQSSARSGRKIRALVAPFASSSHQASPHRKNAGRTKKKRLDAKPPSPLLNEHLLILCSYKRSLTRGTVGVVGNVALHDSPPHLTGGDCRLAVPKPPLVVLVN